MQAYVYTDAKLAPFAERFVWLAIDTEKPGNAATVAKFPVGAWPSMYVIDPQTRDRPLPLDRERDDRAARPLSGGGAAGGVRQESGADAAQS